MSAQTQPSPTWVASLQLVGQRGRLLVDDVDVGNDPGVRIETARAPSRAEDPATREGRLLGMLSCLRSTRGGSFLLFGLSNVVVFGIIGNSREALLEVGEFPKTVDWSKVGGLYGCHSSIEGLRSIGDEGNRRGRVAGCSISLLVRILLQNPEPFSLGLIPRKAIPALA